MNELLGGDSPLCEIKSRVGAQPFDRRQCELTHALTRSTHVKVTATSTSRGALKWCVLNLYFGL